MPFNVAVNVVSEFISTSVIRQLCVNSVVAQRKVLAVEKRRRRQELARQAMPCAGAVPPPVIIQANLRPVNVHVQHAPVIRPDPV